MINSTNIHLRFTFLAIVNLIVSSFLQVAGKSDTHGAGGDGVKNVESKPSADSTVHVKDSGLPSSTGEGDAAVVSSL